MSVMSLPPPDVKPTDKTHIGKQADANVEPLNCSVLRLVTDFTHKHVEGRGAQTFTTSRGYSATFYNILTAALTSTDAMTPFATLVGIGSLLLIFSSVQGCMRGKKSPAAPAGPTGPAGATGLTGPAGATGPMGPPGATGPRGPAGAAGPKGPAGAAGPKGPAGATGLTGPAGAKGPVGPAGAKGPRGPKGTEGYAVGILFATLQLGVILGVAMAFCVYRRHTCRCPDSEKPAKNKEAPRGRNVLAISQY
ncbi:hypothetical protein LSAT2_023951 [Lamellibrachia satsuma]|nr:hypothetical protein LSAT2_023951 [Lamellibrachia satsuma]